SARALGVRSGGQEELFIGGTFTEAGARPAANIARWTDTPPFSATDVTFRVDMRTPMRLGLLRGLSFTFPTSRRPIVDVEAGDAPGTYLLSDLDGDSVWTVRTAMPRGTTIEYAFGYDVSGGGFEPGTDQVHELGGPDGVARSTSLTNAPAHTLPTVAFDNFPLRSIDLDFEFRSDDHFAAGNPSGRTIPGNSPQGNVRVDPADLDRNMQVSARLYLKDPGGAAPDSIALVAETAFWAIDPAPRSAEFLTEITFDYRIVPGIAEPADLRLLYRPNAFSAWQVVPSEANPASERIAAPDLSQIAGEWTIGSVSTANVLSAEAPIAASNPRPANGVLSAPIQPLFEWTGGVNAQSYDLYLWLASEAEPVQPLAEALTEGRFKHTSNLLIGETYNWRVVAKNINGETPGPVWSFTVGAVPDLTVT